MRKASWVVDWNVGTGNFKFDDWEGGEIFFVSTYVRPKGDDVDSENGLSRLRDWLVKYM